MLILYCVRRDFHGEGFLKIQAEEMTESWPQGYPARQQANIVGTIVDISVLSSCYITLSGT
jgi:hypothetical protein